MHLHPRILPFQSQHFHFSITVTSFERALPSFKGVWEGWWEDSTFSSVKIFFFYFYTPFLYLDDFFSKFYDFKKNKWTKTRPSLVETPQNLLQSSTFTINHHKQPSPPLESEEKYPTLSIIIKRVIRIKKTWRWGKICHPVYQIQILYKTYLSDICLTQDT